MGSRDVVAIVALALIALSIVVGGIVLALRDKNLSDSLIALGGVAVGALAGVLLPRQAG